MAAITNVTHGLPVAGRVKVARDPWTRLLGLLPRRSLDAEEGMIFPRCHAIHTYGMRFAIDVVFLKGQSVVKVVGGLTPGRLATASQADTVIELAPGIARLKHVQQGVVLQWQE